MTLGLERFVELLDAYGADPARWPAAERDAAEGFLASSDEARALHLEARQLDEFLDVAPVIEPSAELRRAVLASAPVRRAPRLSRIGWASGAGWAAAAAAGVILGVSIGDQMATNWMADSALDQASTWSADEAEYLG